MNHRKKKNLKPSREFLSAAGGDHKLALKAEQLVRSLRARASKRKGGSNEDRSIQFVLDHPEIYNVLDKEHIQYTPRGTRFHKDLFSVKYKEKEGKENKAGFDLACLAVPPMGQFNYVLHLIQVKSGRTWTKAYEQALRKFEVGGFINKEIHLWEGDKLTVISLNLNSK